MSTKPLSRAAYEMALRMSQSDSRMARPNLEDFAHLDVTPSPEPEQPAPPPVAAPATVADALVRMQAETRVKFAEPVAQSQPRTQWYGGDGRDA